MYKLITDSAARAAIISKINAATRLTNMAPGTAGRLEYSFGIPEITGVPQVAASLDRDGVWRFYDATLGGGGLRHEERGNPILRQWADTQTQKFNR